MGRRAGTCLLCCLWASSADKVKKATRSPLLVSIKGVLFYLLTVAGSRVCGFYEAHPNDENTPMKLNSGVTEKLTPRVRSNEFLQSPF